MIKIFDNVVIKIWFFPLHLPLMPISEQEKSWKKELSIFKKYQFHFSRGYARVALSTLFKLKPLEVPITARPNKAPFLKNSFGFVSISHCKDGLIIGWSISKLGIDIESRNRPIVIKKLSEFLLSSKEKEYLYSKTNNLREKFLSIWVRKEALIKFSHGNIIRDFKIWQIDFDKNTAKNKKLSRSIFVRCIKYKKWLIGLASENNIKK
tara:strand:+ start:97 stop:720 length:624 start_codon:yes stop_codon:yes gene_type:complete